MKRTAWNGAIRAGVRGGSALLLGQLLVPPPAAAAVLAHNGNSWDEFAMFGLVMLAIVGLWWFSRKR